jgi:hypothetical protein
VSSRAVSLAIEAIVYWTPEMMSLSPFESLLRKVVEVPIRLVEPEKTEIVPETG